MAETTLRVQFYCCPLSLKQALKCRYMFRKPSEQVNLSGKQLYLITNKTTNLLLQPKVVMRKDTVETADDEMYTVQRNDEESLVPLSTQRLEIMS